MMIQRLYPDTFKGKKGKDEILDQLLLELALRGSKNLPTFYPAVYYEICEEERYIEVSLTLMSDLNHPILHKVEGENVTLREVADAINEVFNMAIAQHVPDEVAQEFKQTICAKIAADLALSKDVKHVFERELLIGGK